MLISVSNDVTYKVFITGKDFNQIYNDNFFKITNQFENDDGNFQIVDGDNNLNNGSIKFTSQKNFPVWLGKHTNPYFIRKCIIPDDAQVFVNDTTLIFETDKIFLEKKCLIKDSILIDSTDVQKLIVKQNGRRIKFIKNPTEHVQKLAILQISHSICYIKRPSETIKQFAVLCDPNALCYIKNPSDEILKIAVQQYPNAICHIRNPSDALQKTAVDKDPCVARLIANPSDYVKKIISEQQRKPTKETSELAAKCNIII